MEGIFIALEGPDGSGKSSIMELIVDYLKNRGIDLVWTREPGGTEIGEKIRELLLDGENENMVGETEALLYAASRGQLVHEKILPALKEGKVVLCDRFLLSSLAYQGVARGLGVREVMGINDFAIKGFRPDLTLFYHVDLETALNRRLYRNKKDRLEGEGAEFHGKVYRAYMELLEGYSDRIEIIDGSKAIDEVLKESIYYIENILKGRN